MFFLSDLDFINSGLIRDLDSNGYEDYYMSLFTATFTVPFSAEYQFQMDRKNDRHVLWLDLDQNDIFEGWGSGYNGQGNYLNPTLSSKPSMNLNFDTNQFILFQGQEYRIAVAMLSYGGGSSVRARFRTSNDAAWKTFNPSDPSQDGMFTINGLSNGKFLHEQSLLEANMTGLTPGSTYYYRVRLANSEGVTWEDSTTSFVSENTLNINAGKLNFNTNGPVPTWSASNGRGGQSQIVNQSFVDKRGLNFLLRGQVRLRPDLNWPFWQVIYRTITFLNVDGNASILPLRCQRDGWEQSNDIRNRAEQLEVDGEVVYLRVTIRTTGTDPIRTTGADPLPVE